MLPRNCVDPNVASRQAPSRPGTDQNQKHANLRAGCRLPMVGPRAPVQGRARSGRLFLDRVARQHCPSPLHRHGQNNMHPLPAQAEQDISTLQRIGHFYFALTGALPIPMQIAIRREPEFQPHCQAICLPIPSSCPLLSGERRGFSGHSTSAGCFAGSMRDGTGEPTAAKCWPSQTF